MKIEMFPFTHPSFRTLDRFARGTLSDAERVRFAPHLERCVRCRMFVARQREVLEWAHRSDRPQPRPELLAEVLARRAAGDAVILPLEEKGRSSAVWHRATSIGVLAATLIIGLAFALLTRSRDVLAGDIDGVLHVTPSLPHERVRINVEYDAPATWARRRRLDLRVRLRMPADFAYQARGRYLIVPLDRTADQHFHGTFLLPDSVIYAAMVVEDTAARQIDTHGNAFWELLTTDDGRRPSYAALEQRENNWMGRNWETARDAAETAVRLYPNDPRSWHQLWFYEQNLLSSSALDTARATHRAHFAALHKRLASDERVPGDIMGNMYFYARGLGDSAAATYWDTRLRREAPADPFTVQNRAADIAFKLWRRDSVATLPAYESLWKSVAHLPGSLERQGSILPRLGLDAATRLRDVTAIRRWGARMLSSPLADTMQVADAFVETPALHDSGLALLRYRLAARQVPDDSYRPLDRTRPEHHRETERQYGDLLGRYGQALVRAHAWTAAADTLDRAASIGWRPDLILAAAAAHLALRDTLAALRDYAAVSVDPIVGDSIRSKIDSARARVDDKRWRTWTDSAANTIRERLLADAIDKSLRGEIQLRDSRTGVSSSLGALRDGRPAVVVFWSAHCGPALAAVPRINQLSAELRPLGANVVIVSGDSLTADDRVTLRSRGATFAVYQDAGHGAQRAFANFGTPAFYVLDADGHVRFEWARPDDIVRELFALGLTTRRRDQASEAGRNR